MVWGKQVVQKLTESCWQCGRRFKSEQTICMSCGAVRVAEELAPKLAIPTNGWYEPPEPFHIPTRFGHPASRPMTEQETQVARDNAALSDVGVFPPAVPSRAYVPSQPVEPPEPEPASSQAPSDTTLASGAGGDGLAPQSEQPTRQRTPSQPLHGVAAWVRGLMGVDQDETRP